MFYKNKHNLCSFNPLLFSFFLIKQNIKIKEQKAFKLILKSLFSVKSAIYKVHLYIFK